MWLPSKSTSVVARAVTFWIIPTNSFIWTISPILNGLWMVRSKLDIKFSAISLKAKPKISPTTPVPLTTAIAKPVNPAKNRNRYMPSKISIRLTLRWITERNSGDAVVRVKGFTSTFATWGANSINATMITAPSANPGKRYTKLSQSEESNDCAFVKLVTPPPSLSCIKEEVNESQWLNCEVDNIT